jgi:hypothetical protein
MDGILASMLQIALDLQGLCKESFVVLLLALGSFEVLAVAMTPELLKLCGESSVVLPLELGSVEALAVALAP